MGISTGGLSSLTVTTFIIVIRTIVFAVHTNFTAVTPIAGLEEHYLRLRYLKPTLEWPTEESIKIKEDICASIFDSAFFNDVHNVYHIERTEEDEIYARHRRRRRATRKNFTDASDPSTYHYKLREISVLERVVHEFVFPCLTRTRSSRAVVEYFVSREYVLNPFKEVGASGPFGRLGRFVFEQNDEDGKTVPTAVAENPPAFRIKPGIEWDAVLIHWLHPRYDQHERTRTISAAAILDQSRAICDLTVPQRVRLCTVVLSHYPKIRFSPSANVEPQCKQVDIAWNATRYYALEQPITEFAIECKAKTNRTKPEIFYIAEGVKFYRYLLSKKTRNGTILQDIVDMEL